MENKNFKPIKKNNKIKNNNNQNISLNLKDNENENKNKKNNNIYVINNIYIKNKNDNTIKKENNKKNNENIKENIKENDAISGSSRRIDRLGNEIKKGGSQKICFLDKIDHKKLVETENIESYKDYNKSEEITTSNTKSLCCIIY